MGLVKSMKRQKMQKYEGIAKRAAKSYTQAVKKNVDNIKISSYTTCTSMAALFLTVMRQDFGFGEKRLRALIRKAGYTATCLRLKYVTVKDIAAALLEETGFMMSISYQPQKKDYVSSVDANIDRCTDKITAIFMLALRDVFDFGKARLKRVGDALNDLSGQYVEGKIEIRDLIEDLEKINIGVV